MTSVDIRVPPMFARGQFELKPSKKSISYAQVNPLFYRVFTQEAGQRVKIVKKELDF